MIMKVNGVAIGIAGFCLVEDGCGYNDTKGLNVQPTPYGKKMALKITKALAAKVHLIKGIRIIFIFFLSPDWTVSQKRLTVG